MERRLGRITDVGLCVGTGVAVEAVRRIIAPERVRTIGVAVDATGPTVNPQRRAAARAALGLPPEAIVVGCVGRLAYQKAPEHFVDALTRIDRADVFGVWIGGGELEGDVRRAIGRAGGRTRIILAGERSDVPSLLPAFDVFALPSRYEGLPVAIVEAMVCGVPVVATAVNAVSDAVVPGQTGLLVPPERPDLLAGAIAYLLDDPSAAARMAGRAAAERPFRPARLATLGAALESAYQPAARSAAGRPGTHHEERVCTWTCSATRPSTGPRPAASPCSTATGSHGDPG